MRLRSALGVSILLGAAACASPQATAPEPSASNAASTRPSASLIPSPTAIASATPSASAAIPDVWTNTLTFGVGDAWHVAGDVVHGKAGFLALGQRIEPAHGGPSITARYAWRSPDGLAWEQVPVPEVAVAGFIQELIATPDGDYVLFFDRPHSDPNTGSWDTVALRSSDGSTWSEVETGLPSALSIDSIERGAMGYLLVGDQTALGNPTLWLSSDGIGWAKVHEFTQNEHWVQLHGGGAGDEGFVVFGRRIEHDSSSYRRFAFASGDGYQWVETPAPLGADDQDFVFDVVVDGLGPDWVAASAERDSRAPTWFSADGIGWEPAGEIPAEHPENWDPVLDEADGELYFSATGEASHYPGAPGGAWSSTDGRTWQPIELGADAHLGAVVDGPDAIVLAGTIVLDDRASAIGIWVRAAD